MVSVQKWKLSDLIPSGLHQSQKPPILFSLASLLFFSYIYLHTYSNHKSYICMQYNESSYPLCYSNTVTIYVIVSLLVFWLALRPVFKQFLLYVSRYREGLNAGKLHSIVIDVDQRKWHKIKEEKLSTKKTLQLILQFIIYWYETFPENYRFLIIVVSIIICLVGEDGTAKDTSVVPRSILRARKAKGHNKHVRCEQKSCYSN